MLKCIVKFLVVILGACAYTGAFAGELVMSNPLLSKSRPWCIGRFVFDRPSSSEVTSQKYAYRGDKIETQYGLSIDVYRAKVDSREKELREKRRMDRTLFTETGPAWLERAFSPIDNSRVLVFQQGMAKNVRLPFDTESYVYEDGTLFHMTGGIGSAAIDRVEDIYGDIVRRIKLRDNWTVPKESGFCVDGGIVTGSSTSTEEVSQSFALMPGRPALLVIKMRDSVQGDQKEPLIGTLPELRAQLSRLPGHYRILREGKRPFAGMDAEEVLFELQDAGVTSYRFYLLAPGDPRTLAKPHTAIQLLLGTYRTDLAPDQATSPVDAAGALQVWDTLLNSFRLRPGAV